MPPKTAMHLLSKGLNKLKLGGNDTVQEPEEEEPRDDTDDEKPEKHGKFERGQRTPVYPQPGHANSAKGHMPPRVANLDYRGKMRFFKPDGEPHQVLRDLGFSGVIDGRVVWCWGDTLMGTQKKSMICANDSTSIGSVKKPMTACDTAMKDGHVMQWIPATDEEKAEGGIVRFGYGGTNIIEHAPNKGLVYYLKNDRKGGGANIRGAGVALVHMDGDIPRAKRVHDTLWGPNEPKYGDVGIAYDPRDKHVYVYGHGPDGDKELVSRTYLCRAPAEEATNIHKYEYWDNGEKTWRKRRPTRDGAHNTNLLTPKMAIFDWYNINQSAPFWSTHFSKWMLLYGDCFGFSSIKCKTAEHLEGPWKDHGEVAKTDPKPGAPLGKAFRYCQTGHPWVDDSGKKVLVTWTRANWIWGVMVTWE